VIGLQSVLRNWLNKINTLLYADGHVVDQSLRNQQVHSTKLANNIILKYRKGKLRSCHSDGNIISK